MLASAAMMTAEAPRSVTEESTSKYAQAGGVRVHYNEVGSGPPILCIHGAGPGASAWSNFRGNIQDLARDNRMIMMDMPGFGKSDKPIVTENRLTFWAGVIDKFLDALGIDQVDIVGNSMGGQAGIKLAIDRPRRVKHLVIIGSTPVQAVGQQPLPLEGIRNISEFYDGAGPSKEKMRRTLTSLVYDASFLTDELVEERYQAAIAPDLIDWNKHRAPAQDLYFELGNNKAPTLIVWGQDDRAGALEVGLLMLRKFPNARMHVFQRCGHWAHVEHREEFDPLVLDFFRQ